MTDSAGLRVAHLIRSMVGAICVCTVAGMIASAITHHLGAVVALGCVTIGVIVVLIAVSSVSSEEGLRAESGYQFDEAQSAHVEQLVVELAGQGTSEDALRSLVGAAVQLGQSARPSEQ